MPSNFSNKDNFHEKYLCNTYYENSQISEKKKESKLRIDFIYSTYPRLFNSRRAKVPKLIQPSFKTLKSKYFELTNKLNSANPEAMRTRAESRFKTKLRLHSKKQLKQSIWIGSHCIDLFIPNIRSHHKYPKKVMRGLAIEIDGDCHKYEQKGIKDERKGAELLDLGIGTIHIPNWEFNETTIKDILKSISNFEPLDSRERIRLWTRIFTYTLATHLTHKEFFQIFKVKPDLIGDKNE